MWSYVANFCATEKGVSDVKYVTCEDTELSLVRGTVPPAVLHLTFSPNLLQMPVLMLDHFLGNTHQETVEPEVP